MGAPCSKEEAMREAAPILAKIVLDRRAKLAALAEAEAAEKKAAS